MAKKAITSSTQVERTLDSDALLERLHLHAATTNEKSFILIEITESFVQFTTATHLALRQSRQMLEGKLGAVVLVSYHQFTDIVSNMTGDMTIGIDEEKRMLYINRDEVFISGIDPDDATVIPKRAIEPTFIIEDGEALSKAIGRCDYAATTAKEKRPNLEGLSFSNVDEFSVVEIIGANGIVFCFDTTTRVVGGGEPFQFFIHNEMLPTLKFLPKEPITFAIDNEKGRCWLIGDEWEMMIRLADYKFPIQKLKDSTPTDGQNIVTVDTKVFKKAYALPRIAGQISTTTTNGDNKIQALLTEITFNDTEMTIQTYNGGETHGAKKTIPCVGVGSGRMIIDQLMDKNIEYLMGRPRMTFTFRDPTSPYLVTSDAIPGYVTMTMQIQPLNDKGKK